MSFLQSYKHIWSGLSVLMFLVIVRVAYTGNITLFFLYWNVFLAVLPLYFSHKLLESKDHRLSIVLLVLWLPFFPNSTYLFTDIKHLHRSPGILYWLDMVILFMTGIYGMVIGLLSLSQVERWYGRYISSPALRKLISLVLLFACGYGMYLGRIERWNAWDVIAQPEDLLFSIINHHIHPIRNKEVWMMSGLFAIGIWVVYQVRFVFPTENSTTTMKSS